MKFNYIFLLTAFLVLSLGTNAQGLASTTRVGPTFPSLSAFVMGTGEQLSGQQFQTDGILTYKGYQYTVYYNLNRNVCIARRKMPVGAWEEVVLPYRNTVNDAHNTISIGISHKDGRIHLSYDHHNDPLRYCYSIRGSANDPENMPWEAASFSPTTNIMDKAVPNVTYPRFISMPNGNLLFECRFRWSGFGDSYLREYDAETQTWSLVGRYIQGEDFTPDACAYINGMSYDHLGRLHITWCWRDDFGGSSNHDFYYAYSEDHGRTWKDTHGDAKATTDVMDPVLDRVTRGALGQTKRSYMVEAIPLNRGYINQETQDIDTRGRIHAINSHIPDGQASDSNWGSARNKARLHHRFRKEDGTWVKRLVTVNGVSVNSIRRVHLAIDSFDNAYIMANNVGVLMASPDDDYANWTLISEDGKSGFLSEPLADKPLLRENGVLSFVYLSTDNRIVVYDHLTKNPNTPNGTGLTAEYFYNDNLTGLISSEVVANPNAGTIPAETKSIRWSGTFETLLGEKYNIYLNTSSKANVYINDKLQKVILENSGSHEHEINYDIIPSHKNNIVIELTGNEPATLSWSSQGTVKELIPSSSLYPVKANDKPGTLTPPVLPVRSELDNILMDSKLTINTTDRQVVELTPFDPPAEYSIEVKARINSVTGRGLDIESRAKTGKGMRVSLDRTSINWTSPLNDANEISAVDNSVEQIYRFAVKEDKVYIYQGQDYIGSRNTDFIRDILPNGEESATAGTYGPEIIGNWAGPSGTGTAAPTAYGWDATGATVLWNTANSGSGVRYLDITSASNPQHLLNEAVYTGRLLTVRWDGNLGSNVYYYPVTLEANTIYEFSMVYEHWNNGPIGAPISVGISQSKTQAGIYASDSYPTIDKNRLQTAKFRFSSREAGQYFITFTGTSGTMYAIGDLSLKSLSFENTLMVGKNYEGGNANMEIFYVSYQEGAFAPGETIIAVPDLPLKAVLPTEIQSAITLNAASGSKDIRSLSFDPQDDYSVEVSVSVDNSEGRGMDLEVRDGNGTGFRTALSSESLRWAAPFSAIRQITASENSTQIIRYAVQGEKVHIYRNGKFSETFNLTQIGDMNEAGTAELNLSVVKPSDLYDGVNLIPNADFRNDAHNAAPAGWTSDVTMGGSPNPRIQEKSQTTELSAYPDGKKAFMFRFDANGGNYYAYQVNLKTNNWHELSFDLITWGENQNAEFDVIIATNAAGTSGIVSSQRVKTPAVRATAERQMVRFRASTTATVPNMNYFIVLRKVGTVGTMAITDLYLKEGGINQILFGKNYTEGGATIKVDYLHVDYSGAFAPETITSDQSPSLSSTSPIIIGREKELFITNLKSETAVTVFDLMGRRVLHSITNSNTFSATLQSGVYIVKANSQVQKVIIK